MGSMQQQQLTDEQGARAGQANRSGPAPLPPAEDAAPRTQQILTQTVEQHVIPRLLLARRDDAAGAASPTAAADAGAAADPSISEAQVAGLVALVLARDEAASLAYVEALHTDGIPAETLYLDLLAPTARQLGQMWVDDDCDFTDVTVGLFLLQNSLRELGAAHHTSTAVNPAAPRILLVPLPREQHTFGLSMVYDFFCRAGWNAWSGTIESEGELAAMVRESWFDVVGFSLPCDEQLDDARAMIGMVRASSLNPGVAVMVGGPGFAADPSLAATIGADGTATDGRQAVRAADALLARASARQCS